MVAISAGGQLPSARRKMLHFVSHPLHLHVFLPLLNMRQCTNLQNRPHCSHKVSSKAAAARAVDMGFGMPAGGATTLVVLLPGWLAEPGLADGSGPGSVLLPAMLPGGAEGPGMEPGGAFALWDLLAGGSSSAAEVSGGGAPFHSADRAAGVAPALALALALGFGSALDLAVALAFGSALAFALAFGCGAASSVTSGSGASAPADLAFALALGFGSALDLAVAFAFGSALAFALAFG
jgi:hypothetical protein